MESVTLATKPRDARGKRAAKHLRTEGLIPAVLYGHKEAVVAVSLSAEELMSAIRHHARVMDLAIGGKSETAVIQEVQYDHLGKEILHVDFKRVSKDERIVVSVVVELKGTAPGTSAGVLEQPLHELEVECLAIAIPESIKCVISTLQLGEAVHVRDLAAPEGVKILNPPDSIVVQIKAPVLEAVPVVAAAAPVVEGATPAEPEIVGRRVAKEEPEEK
jgi:large subunit ribosomal protein L25